MQAALTFFCSNSTSTMETCGCNVEGMGHLQAEAQVVGWPTSKPLHTLYVSMSNQEMQCLMSLLDVYVSII